MNEERKRFMIVQKDKFGLYTMDALLKHDLKKSGVVPNIYVFPEKMNIYVNLVGEHNTNYTERGPLANEKLERGEQKQTFRGVPVFESQSFDIEFQGDGVNLLNRDQSVGSWYRLPAPEGTKGQKGYDSGDRYIYDADKDQFVKMTRSVAWTKCVNVENDKLVKNDPNNNPNNVSQRSGPGPSKDLTENDCDILLFRPAQTFQMGSAILAKGGKELGSTFHGHHDFMLSDDTIRKVHRL